jgi:hypothetical protein
LASGDDDNVEACGYSGSASKEDVYPQSSQEAGTFSLEDECVLSSSYLDGIMFDSSFSQSMEDNFFGCLSSYRLLTQHRRAQQTNRATNKEKEVVPIHKLLLVNIPVCTFFSLVFAVRLEELLAPERPVELIEELFVE